MVRAGGVCHSFLLGVEGERLQLVAGQGAVLLHRGIPLWEATEHRDPEVIAARVLADHTIAARVGLEIIQPVHGQKAEGPRVDLRC